MDILYRILFFSSAFLIFWAMIGYPVSLNVISKFYKKRTLIKDYNHQPTVTVMVVAHNEEKVILNKLHNIIDIDYPKDKIKFIISSDNSTDNTNEIVENYITENTENNIRLYKVNARKGKTNAQNEAQKMVDSEYLVMTDANSLLARNSVRELMAAFTSSDIAYVSGKLAILNSMTSDISKAENTYWDRDLKLREIEGRIQTITAGNGALYACKNSEYFDFDPIQSHDSAMPQLYAMEGKRAIANHDALAYEKAGEVIEDEFSRKVRMNRLILNQIIPDIKIFNIFKYKWFTYFYLGHRSSRYLLWISHLLLLLSSLQLSSNSLMYFSVFIGQLIFYILALLKVILKTRNKYLTIVYYYTVTIIAQWIGVFRILTGKAKPFWEKAESTR